MWPFAMFSIEEPSIFSVSFTAVSRVVVLWWQVATQTHKMHDEIY